MRIVLPAAAVVATALVAVPLAGGASVQRQTGPAPTTMTLKAKKVQHKKVTLKGKVGPKAAVAGGSVVAYRVERDGLHQLFGKNTLKKNGEYKIVAPDEPGKNKYKVNFNPRDPYSWQFASKTIKVKLKAR